VPRRPQKYQETWRVVPGVGTSELLERIFSPRTKETACSSNNRSAENEKNKKPCLTICLGNGQRDSIPYKTSNNAERYFTYTLIRHGEPRSYIARDKQRYESNYGRQQPKYFRHNGN